MTAYSREPLYNPVDGLLCLSSKYLTTSWIENSSNLFPTEDRKRTKRTEKADIGRTAYFDCTWMLAGNFLLPTVYAAFANLVSLTD